MNLLQDDLSRDPGNKFSDEMYKIFDELNSIPVTYYRLVKMDIRDRFVFQVMVDIDGILSYRKIIISHNPRTDEFKYEVMNLEV